MNRTPARHVSATLTLDEWEEACALVHPWNDYREPVREWTGWSPDHRQDPGVAANPVDVIAYIPGSRPKDGTARPAHRAAPAPKDKPSRYLTYRYPRVRRPTIDRRSAELDRLAAEGWFVDHLR